MDVLARLRDDMDMVGCEAAGLGENVLDACLEILDEFIAGYEERTLGEQRHSDDGSVYYADGHDPDFNDLSKYQGRRVRTFVALFPRERKPGLLGAAERVVATRDDFENCRDALDALAAALQEEER